MISLNTSKPTPGAEPSAAAVVNSIGDVYYVLDSAWRIVLFNEAARKFVGWTHEALQGASLWEVFPEGAGTPFQQLLEAAKDGKPGRLTAPSRIRPDRVIDFRAAPLDDGMIGVSLIDVTERARAEAAMLESRERLDLAVGAHGIGIYDWHIPSGRIVWSPELEAIFGMEPGTFDGARETFRRFVIDEDFERAQAVTDVAIAERRDLIAYNFRIRRRDGAVRWIEGVSRVVYAEDGSPERIVGTNFDITERVEAEHALRESRDRLDLAVAAHCIGVFDWEVRSGRVVWSPEMQEMFGLKPGEFTGQLSEFRDRVVPEDLAAMDAATQAAIAARQDVVKVEFRIRRADGAVRWLESVARLIYGPNGKIERVVGTNIDVTERIVGEQHQRLLINELNHRVKNTLAIVQAIAWQSFRSGEISEPARDAFEGRLAALASAHDVLTRQNWEAGSIHQILGGAVAPHDPGDGRLSLNGPSVALEPKTAVALALAVHELATNAVKHGALSVPGGTVEVAWTLDAGLLKLSWRERGGPRIAGPIKRGFGTHLLERGLGREFTGGVRLDFQAEGVVCVMETRLPA